MDHKTQRMIEEGVITIERKGIVNTYLGSLREEELAKPDNLRMILGRVYEDIKQILKIYVDMDEKYYHFTTLWVIGTYLHDNFGTFPILYINAMKGSGKTRFINLISALSYKGLVTTSLKEAVLFRMGKRTLCIDEFEQIGSKEFQTIRELLNSCYKRGLKVLRNKKVKKEGQEKYEIEEFEPYKPVAIANIYGMEEVLEDRSVTIILEQSNDSFRTKLSEDFDDHPIVNKVKGELENIQENLVKFFSQKGILKQWNKYLIEKYNNITTQTTLTTLTTQEIQDYNVVLNSYNVVLRDQNLSSKKTTLTTLEKKDLHSFFNRIDEVGINGRNLELIMPFLEISSFLSSELFDKTLNITKEIIKEKKSRESVESRDIAFFDFCSQLGMDRDFIPIKKLTTRFKHYMGDDEGDERWITTRWVGRALKRLKLRLDHKRVSEGIEVRIDVDKAINKMKSLK